MLRLVCKTIAAVLALGAAQAHTADSYPVRPIRIIIPSGAGGITDILGRVIAPKLTESLGQQVVVDNRPGASGIVGSTIVAKETADGGAGFRALARGCDPGAG